MKLTRTLSALVLLALPLSAQVAVEVSANAVVASQGMNQMVVGNNLAGTSFGLGLQIPITPSFGHRIHVNVMSMRGVAGSGMEDSGHFYQAKPQHLYAGWDITQKLGKKWTVYGGLMAMKWKQDDAQITNPNFGDIARPSGSVILFPSSTNTNNSAKGTKLGARIGVERPLARGVSMNFSYQQTEFNKIYNPGWFNMGLTYRFGGK